jgi:cysteine-rich repeat protein
MRRMLSIFLVMLGWGVTGWSGTAQAQRAHALSSNFGEGVSSQVDTATAEQLQLMPQANTVYPNVCSPVSTESWAVVLEPNCGGQWSADVTHDLIADSPILHHVMVKLTPICGNNSVEPGEICDDGNPVDGDGCDNNCTPTACGNGIVTSGETCDDGNANECDGCDSTCNWISCGSACLADGDCGVDNWCNDLVGAGSCQPKVVNGDPVPGGSCTLSLGSRACVSGACNASTNLCAAPPPPSEADAGMPEAGQTDADVGEDTQMDIPDAEDGGADGSADTQTGSGGGGSSGSGGGGSSGSSGGGSSGGGGAGSSGGGGAGSSGGGGIYPPIAVDGSVGQGGEDTASAGNGAADGSTGDGSPRLADLGGAGYGDRIDGSASGSGVDAPGGLAADSGIDAVAPNGNLVDTGVIVGAAKDADNQAEAGMSDASASDSPVNARSDAGSVDASARETGPDALAARDARPQAVEAARADTPPGPASKPASGCHCTVSGTPTSSGLLWFALAALICGARRLRTKRTK